MKKMNLTHAVTAGFAFVFFPLNFAAAIWVDCEKTIPEPYPGCPKQGTDMDEIDNGIRCMYEAESCEDVPKSVRDFCECAESRGMDYQCFCEDGYESTTRGISRVKCTCNQCPENTYPSGEGRGCIPCPEGATSAPGSASCTCKQGYYYDTESRQCLLCPFGAKDIDWKDVRGTSAVTGGVVIGDCFLPGNTNYYDTLGRYKYATSCYYK